MASLLCEHWELFSEAWQTSGMMRNGQVFALPMPAHLTADSEFSSPQQELMPTPNTMEHREIKTPEQIAVLKEKSPGGYRNLREEVINNLPTPTTRDYKDGTAEHEREGIVQTDTVARAIFNSGEILLPTTRVSMAHGATSKEIQAGNPKSRIETEVMLGEVSWGKFEPAIRRWEAVMNRPAPAPTLPDGKDGAHRLSPWFTEWMMGLPESWICDPEIGLTRNEQLKACGNGVVPQQAELALRILLEGVDFSLGGGQVNLPTPTVSDTFTSNLKSTQQKEGSMHSVTLPQAVERLVDNCG
jgi:DNA (cytosine-5)-methyltransferase 1